jgi:aminoglycoside 3-N-acetyltransferase I
MAYDVRQLGPTDLAAMRGLNGLFADAFEDPESYGSRPPSDAYLASLLENPANLVVIAQAGEVIVGGLVAYQLDKFEQQRSEIYIYDLAVAENFRRQGIATALIDHLRQIARSRGAWVIYVQADYVDPPAIALYEKLGQREEVLHFDITV